jgi:sarcosine oxidase subunit beta
VSVDVAVVGAGVIGASIAYHLAKVGASVALVDRAGPAEAPGATWASAGGLRSQGRHKEDQPLTRLAAARWPNLARELEADLEVRLGGHLHVAETETEEAALDQRIASDLAGGIAVEKVIGKALREIAPGLNPNVRAGAFTRGDGQAHPGRTALAFAEAARRHRARLLFGEAVRPIVKAGRVVALEVGRERLLAGTIVLATGAWSVRLWPELGVHLALRWRGLTMLLSEIDEMRLGPTVTAVGRNLSLKQSSTGQFMIGGRWFARPTGVEPRVEPLDAHVARQWSSAVAILPAMARLRLAQSWAGAEAQTPDSHPYLGPCEFGGPYLAAGFSNHGFQISPAVGALVACDILEGPEPLLEPFRPERAAAFSAEAVRAFVDESVLL